MMKCVAIFLILTCVSACSRQVVMSACAPIPPKNLITVEDFILRATELEEYLNACLKQNAQAVE